jgi:hypothetical protein
MMNINKEELKEWIQKMSQDSLMLTIARPHAKALNLKTNGADLIKIEETHMQHVIDRIINLSSRYVYGTNKKFEFLKGLVVQEGGIFNPHYHIIFQKPEAMEFQRFKDKLTRLAVKFCDPNFEFDLTDAPLPNSIRKVLSKPAYKDFARVTDCHTNTGGYLTKLYSAKYYVLQARGFDMKQGRIEVYVDHTNPTKETAYATRTIYSDSGCSIQL